MKSELPDFKEIYNQYLMKIVQIAIDDTLYYGRYDTHIDDMINDTSINNVDVYLIKDSQITGNVPHKVWWDDIEQNGSLYFIPQKL